VAAIRHLLARRHLAVLLCAATLLLKLLVPAGYMIGTTHGHLSMELCSGVAPPVAAAGMPGMHGDMSGHGKSRDGGKADMPCAFSALSAASLGAVDPVQLAALVAFIMAVALLPVAAPAPSRRAHLRPPLRGPPLTA
jgi:hypothetical protein